MGARNFIHFETLTFAKHMLSRTPKIPSLDPMLCKWSVLLWVRRSKCLHISFLH